MKQLCLLHILSAILLTSTPAKSNEINKSPENVHRYAEAGFEIVSGRNTTGHWNSKLRFTHSASRGKLEEENDHDAWKMKYDQKVHVTEKGEMVSLYATVTIPPAGYAAIDLDGTSEKDVDPKQDYREVIGHGYQHAEGLGYYKFHAEPLTWYGALMKCQAETAHLMIINSEDEAKIVRRLYQKHPSIHGANNNDLAFVGVTDLETEGVYVTIFGESLQDVGYQNWRTNQPNNYGGSPGEDCVAVDREGQLYDWECYLKLAFFCEKSL